MASHLSFKLKRGYSEMYGFLQGKMELAVVFDDAVSLMLHQVHGYRRCYRHCREVVMIKGCNSKGFKIVIRCSY